MPCAGRFSFPSAPSPACAQKSVNFGVLPIVGYAISVAQYTPTHINTHALFLCGCLSVCVSLSFHLPGCSFFRTSSHLQAVIGKALLPVDAFE